MKQKHSYYIETVKRQRKEVFKFHFPPTKSLATFIRKIAKTGRDITFLRDNTNGRVLVDKRNDDYCLG